jgi:hypothetical protein
MSYIITSAICCCAFFCDIKLTDVFVFFGAIATAVMAYFTYHGMKANAEDNKKNRDLMKHSFSYQQEMRLLENVRKACVDSLASISPSNIIGAYNILVLNRLDFKYFMDYMHGLVNKVTVADTKLKIFLDGKTGNEVTLLVKAWNGAYDKYASLCSDVQFIGKFMAINNPDEQTINKFKSDCKINAVVPSEMLSGIVQDANFNPSSNGGKNFYDVCLEILLQLAEKNGWNINTDKMQDVKCKTSASDGIGQQGVYEKVRKAIIDYIKEEQDRIDMMMPL